jgi:hypothetical protein
VLFFALLFAFACRFSESPRDHFFASSTTPWPCAFAAYCWIDFASIAAGSTFMPAPGCHRLAITRPTTRAKRRHDLEIDDRPESDATGVENERSHCMRFDASIAAIITGGASGLGAAMARRLTGHGVKVALFGSKCRTDEFAPDCLLQQSQQRTGVPAAARRPG